MPIYKLDNRNRDSLPGKLKQRYTVYTPARAQEFWKFSNKALFLFKVQMVEGK